MTVDVRQVELDARALEVSRQAAEKKGTGVFLLQDVEQGLHFVFRQESALKHGRGLVGFGCFRRYFFWKIDCLLKPQIRDIDCFDLYL